ncbi:MAG: LysR family transcriptional regulator, partial [Chloroflexota bacterium]
MVVENGSFLQASRDLFISQPALSLQVKRLEQALGLELLVRSPKGVSPTPAGRELYNSGRLILEQTGAVERRLSRFRSGEGGSLAVGVSHTGALYFVTDLLTAVATFLPGVEVMIEVETPARMFDRILSGSLDAGLEWGPLIPSRLEGTTLFDDQFGIVASPSRYRDRSPTVTRDEFQDGPYITLQIREGTGYLDVWLLEHGLRPRTTTRLPSMDALKRLVE